MNTPRNIQSSITCRRLRDTTAILLMKRIATNASFFFAHYSSIVNSWSIRCVIISPGTTPREYTIDHGQLQVPPLLRMTTITLATVYTMNGRYTTAVPSRIMSRRALTIIPRNHRDQVIHIKIKQTTHTNTHLMSRRLVAETKSIVVKN